MYAPRATLAEEVAPASPAAPAAFEPPLPPLPALPPVAGLAVSSPSLAHAAKPAALSKQNSNVVGPKKDLFMKSLLVWVETYRPKFLDPKPKLKF